MTHTHAHGQGNQGWCTRVVL